MVKAVRFDLTISSNLNKERRGLYSVQGESSLESSESQNAFELLALLSIKFLAVQ
jgi:hypothetical protein